jgi:hypothetical protein
LATIANNFEQYRLNGCVFEFVSTSANALNSTNTALGKLIMATEYNVLNPPFADAPSMLATEFSNYGKPAQNLMHAIECAPGKVPNELYYVRATPPSSGDLRLFDLGNFQIATSGMQAAANVGGLWVTYDVTLCKPILSRVMSFAVLFADHFTWDWTVMGDFWSDIDSDTLTTISYGIGGKTILSNGDFKSHYASNRLTRPFKKPDFKFMSDEVETKNVVRNSDRKSVVAMADGYISYAFPPEMGSGTFLCTVHWRGSVATPAITTFPDVNLQNVEYAPIFAGHTSTAVKTNFSSDIVVQFAVNILTPNAAIGVTGGTMATVGTDPGTFEVVILPVSSLTS